MAKTNKSRRKKRRTAPHPMSAGQREPNGRPSRAYREPKDCGPTRELLLRLAETGPTDMIQRISPPSKYAVLTEDEAKALEMFAMVRHIIGVAEKPYTPMMDAMIPGQGGHANPDVMEWAQGEYREAVAVLSYYEADACQTITDGRAPRTVNAVKSGAGKLAALWIRGEAKKDLTAYAQSA